MNLFSRYLLNTAVTRTRNWKFETLNEMRSFVGFVDLLAAKLAAELVLETIGGQMLRFSPLLILEAATTRTLDHCILTLVQMYH